MSPYKSYFEAIDLESLVTPEMKEYFDIRTNTHIDQVKKNLKIISSLYPELKTELAHRASKHDQDKFIPPYYYSQILRVWNKAHPEFVRSSEVKRASMSAIFKHLKSNRHHIEYHKDASKMTNADIAEMLADQAAMSKEFKTNLKAWEEKNILIRRNSFTNTQVEFIYELIEALS